MNIILSALAAIIPISLYLFFIWYYDRFDREPVGLYLKNFLWGSIGAILLSIIGGLTVARFILSAIHDPQLNAKYEILLITPIIEECMKAVFLVYMFKNRRFDNITDGLVYGGAIGLGFGMTENFLYFLLRSENVHEWIQLVIVRSLGTAIMHCVATATFGAFLGYTKINAKKISRVFPFIGFSIAIFIHFFWNYSAIRTEQSITGYIFLSILIVIFITVFYISLRSERAMIYRELSGEALAGNIPAEHVSILSGTQREKKGWIAPQIQEPYIECATSLAFRKMQYQNSDDKNKTFYMRDIQIKRIKVHRYLNMGIYKNER